MELIQIFFDIPQAQVVKLKGTFMV